MNTPRTHKQDANAFYAPESTPRTKAACERAWQGDAQTLHFRQAGELGDLCRQLETEVQELRAALELALQGLEVAAERSPQTGDDAFIGYALAADKARSAIAKAKGQQ